MTHWKQRYFNYKTQNSDQWAPSWLFWCQSVKSKAFVFDYRRKPTLTLVSLRKVAQQQATTNAYYLCRTKSIYLQNVSFSSTQHRNLVITIMHFRSHPVMYEKVFKAKVEFSPPMWGHVWLHFIYTCHHWLSGITVCQQTVDSCISLVFSDNSRKLLVIYFNYWTHTIIMKHRYLDLKMNVV